ncbi:MAG: AI-2E family transporter [Acidobacteria bacterium]|nr:AI-2E family transporter [Acidobacteriota bacterium]
MISCVLIGVLCTAGFYSFGLNYALLLGIMAGILEFIPLIGPLTLGLTATIVAGVSDSPRTGIYVAIFLIVLRIVHDYVTYPRIVREGIHLHPLAIIISVLAGEQIGGIAGVFLSIPIVALATVFYKHALEHSGTSGIFAGWLEPKEVEMIEESVVQGKSNNVVAGLVHSLFCNSLHFGSGCLCLRRPRLLLGRKGQMIDLGLGWRRCSNLRVRLESKTDLWRRQPQ